NRWFSDHDKPIAQKDITVTAGKWVYDIRSLKAMSKQDRLHWEPLDKVWSQGVLDPSAVKQYLKEVDVLSNYYWSTSLCGKALIEGPCIHHAVKTIIQRNCENATVFTIPEDILRYPVFDRAWIRAQDTWKIMEDKATTVDPKSPKRYRFKSVDYCAPQYDSYNCGIFILLFFEICLYGDEPAGIEGNSSAAMQFFRYRYLSHILASM
ncbi:hypothetical protein GN958_ATG03707, partial [Phytophthora infestans]